MHYFISYDFSHNRTRRKIVKILQRKGFERVQKSVFFVHALRRRELMELKDELYELLEAEAEAVAPTDSILLIQTEKDHLAKVSFFGDNEAFANAMEDIAVMIF